MVSGLPSVRFAVVLLYAAPIIYVASKIFKGSLIAKYLLCVLIRLADKLMRFLKLFREHSLALVFCIQQVLVHPGGVGANKIPGQCHDEFVDDFYLFDL